MMGLCASKPTTEGGVYRYDAGGERSGGKSAASSSNSSPTSSPSSYHLDNLPKRARDKARALENALKHTSIAHTNPQLAAYADAVLQAASKDGVNPEISRHDAENIEALADTYNARYPELNLSCFASPESFLERLYTSSAPAWRALVRLSNNATHRIAADVRTHADGEKTVLLIESALAFGWNAVTGKHDFMAGLLSLQKNVDMHFNNLKMAVINVDAQKSRIGCMVFSLNLVLSAYQKSDFVSALHERLNDNGRCYESHEGNSEFVSGMEYIDGVKVLPAVFYKHAHSRATVEEVIRNQPHLQNSNVRTNRSSPHETLQDRLQAFRITRKSITGKDRSYSMSIEASRMRKIRKAIEDL
ncbi:hypothetical protein R69746_08214 [Paraburkholderia aspalathi]|nr:hypothetical protein R69746_08214 [Paraburkholderia aspalathi]